MSSLNIEGGLDYVNSDNNRKLLVSAAPVEKTMTKCQSTMFNGSCGKDLHELWIPSFVS